MKKTFYSVALLAVMGLSRLNAEPIPTFKELNPKPLLDSFRLGNMDTKRLQELMGANTQLKSKVEELVAKGALQKWQPRSVVTGDTDPAGWSHNGDRFIAQDGQRKR